MGPHHGNGEQLAGEHVGGSHASPDDSRPGSVNAGVRSLGPAQAELHDGVSFGRVYHPGRLGGNQALVVDDGQKGSLNQLGFHNGGNDLYQGFPGKYHRALGDGINISAEMEVFQVGQKVFVEEIQASQIGNILRGEPEAFDIVNHLLQTGGDGITAVAGVFAVENIENNGLIRMGFEIALHHGQFIQVSQQGEIHGTHNQAPLYGCLISCYLHYSITENQKNQRGIRRIFSFPIPRGYGILNVTEKHSKRCRGS